MSDEPRTPTEAMRLRPRATVAGAQVPTPEAVEAVRASMPAITTRDELTARLEAVLELHRKSELIGYCLECLMPHPCPTYTAASGTTPTTDTPEEESQ